MRQKRVLVAPLDWGLGHATRCVPIIDLLLELECEVFIAGAGSSMLLLQQEFPTLKSFQLPGYNPVYPASGSMMVKLMLQSGKFMKVVRDEQNQTEQLVQENKIDLIISDNRYGCYSAKIPSVFITHQVKLLAEPGWKWLGLLANKVLSRFIEKFTVCWVPDFPGSLLTGKLSASLNSKIRFIGPLSRLKSIDHTRIKYKVVALLSGPEPQRSIFEEIVTKQLVELDLPGLIVRGVIDRKRKMIGDKIEVDDHLDSEGLSLAMAQAEIVVSRSGYSTVMDVARLGKKAIFVPTPGQTEQEYLAKRFMQLGLAFSMEQKSFQLRNALEQSENYKGFVDYPSNDSSLKQNLEEILSVLHQ
jgi:uncharacterized protein (TIGR00661 family)